MKEDVFLLLAVLFFTLSLSASLNANLFITSIIGVIIITLYSICKDYSSRKNLKLCAIYVTIIFIIISTTFATTLFHYPPICGIVLIDTILYLVTILFTTALVNEISYLLVNRLRK